MASLLMLVGSAAALPRVVARLPEDWFVRPPRTWETVWRSGDAREIRRRLARNAIGGLFVVAGAAMLVLPGQGLLTLLLGVLLTDLPIRRRVVGWLCRRRRLARALQRLRQASRQPPFLGLAGEHP